MSTEDVQRQLLKLVLELGPLLVYLAVNAQAGLFWGTGCFMVATVLSLAASWMLQGRIPIMPLVSGVLVCVFGGLTLWLQEEYFIKIKPTVLNSLFAIILFSGLAMGRSWLKYCLATRLTSLTRAGVC